MHHVNVYTGTMTDSQVVKYATHFTTHPVEGDVLYINGGYYKVLLRVLHETYMSVFTEQISVSPDRPVI